MTTMAKAISVKDTAFGQDRERGFSAGRCTLDPLNHLSIPTGKGGLFIGLFHLNHDIILTHKSTFKLGSKWVHFRFTLGSL